MKFTTRFLFLALLLLALSASAAYAATLTLPEDLEVIEAEAFYGDTSIDRVVLPEGIKRIGARAFANSSLSEITLPDSITYIAEDAFEGAELSTVFVGENSYGYKWAKLRMLKIVVYQSEFKYAIENGECSIKEYLGNNTKIIVPDMIDGYPVTKIGNEAFAGAVNWVMSYNTDRKYYYEYENCRKIESVYLPQSIKEIGYYAFCGCVNMTDIEIPDAVNEIKCGTFAGCTSLKSIKLPNALRMIGEPYEYGNYWTNYGAFCECTSLESVDMPNGVIRIAADTFKACYKLKIYAKVETDTAYSLGEAHYSFYDLYCKMLLRYDFDDETNIGLSVVKVDSDITEILWPNSIVKICDNAFEKCSKITNASIPFGITSIGDQAFKSCNNLKSVTIPSSVITIGISAFENCSNLEDITIPFGVTSIGNTAFRSCYNLSTLTISSSVNTIGTGAFEGCSKLTYLSIPSGVASIGDNMFKSCYNLISVDIPSSVKSIGNSAFYGCKNLLNFSIPSGINEIGNYAFYGCKKFTDIVVPTGVTNIGASTYESCSSLTNIVIPGNVTNIGSGAFAFCSNLQNVVIRDGVNNIEKSAFFSCSALASITIPDTVVSVGNTCFNYCSSLNTIYVYQNSYAEKWAKDNGYTYFYIGEDTFGDVNDMDYADYLLWLRAQGEMTGSTVSSADGEMSITMPEAVYMRVGGKQKVSPIFSGSHVFSVYSSSNEDIATVDNEGNITAVAAGEVTITLGVLYSPEGSKSVKSFEAKCHVHVDRNNAITSEDDQKKELSNFQIAIGDTRQLQYVVELLPGTVSGQETWSSSDPFVASVDNNGLVTGISTGRTKISVSNSLSGQETSCWVRVVEAPKTITLSQKMVQLGKGESASMSITTDSIWRNYDCQYDASAVDVSVIGNILRVTAKNTTRSGKKTETSVRISAGDVYTDLRIVIGEAPTGLSMSTTKLEVIKGIPGSASAQLQGMGAAGSVTYYSGNTAIATVDSHGTVSAVSTGTTTITATSYNGYTATCEVTTKYCEEYDQWLKGQQEAESFSDAEKNVEQAIQTFFQKVDEAAQAIDPEKEKAEAEAKLKEAVAKSLTTGADIPADIRDALVDFLTGSIMAELSDGDTETKLKDVSSGEALLKWCYKRIEADAEKFEYKALDGSKYSWDGTTIGKFNLLGVTLSMGSIKSDKHSYTVIFAFKDKTKINAYLDEMREFSEAKTHEAVKEVIKDSLKLLGADKLIEALDEKLQNASVEWLVKKVPALKNIAKDLVKCVDIYRKDLKKASNTFKKIAKYDWNKLYNKPEDIIEFTELYKEIIPLESQILDVIGATDDLILNMNKSL